MFGNDWLLCQKWFTLSYVIDSWHSKLILLSLIKSGDLTVFRTAKPAHRHPVADFFVFHLHEIMSYRFTTIILKAHHPLDNRHNTYRNQSSFILHTCLSFFLKYMIVGKWMLNLLLISWEIVWDQGQAGQRQGVWVQGQVNEAWSTYAKYMSPIYHKGKILRLIGKLQHNMIENR